MLLRRVILHFRNQKWTAIALTVGSGRYMWGRVGGVGSDLYMTM